MLGPANDPEVSAPTAGVTPNPSVLRGPGARTAAAADDARDAAGAAAKHKRHVLRDRGESYCARKSPGEHPIT